MLHGGVSLSSHAAYALDTRLDRPQMHGHAGIAIGGDVFPGSTLSDHCLRYQNIPEIKMIVVLGELGGQVRLACPCLAAQKPDLDPSD